MKKLLVSLLTAMALAATPALAQTWTNDLGDNNFADFGNWIDINSNNPTSWAGDSSNVWQINLAGDDRAILGVTTVTGLDRNLILGEAAGTTGELEINGGTLGINRNLRVGRNTGATGIVTMTSGTLTTGRSSYIGQSDAFGTFNLSGGVVNIATGGGNEELGVAHQSNATGTLNISGSATLNVAAAARGAWIAEGAGANATVSISGSGSLNVGSNARIGFGTDSTATLTISDNGKLDAASGFITFGQAAGADVTVTMSGGLVTADRMIFANAGTATLDMTGGTIDLANSGGGQATAGAFVMGAGASSLSVSGDAVINTEKLYITAGGVLTLSGDAAINISGSTDGVNPTFDFSEAFALDDWSLVLGQIAFNGGSFIVEGSVDPFNSLDYATLLNAAIGEGVIYTNLSGLVPFAQYDIGGDFTELVLVVPEPATVALLMAGASLLLVVLRRRLNSGR